MRPTAYDLTTAQLDRACRVVPGTAAGDALGAAAGVHQRLGDVGVDGLSRQSCGTDRQTSRDSQLK